MYMGFLILAFSDLQDLYELRERIGEGTSGVVRRAINRVTGKQVAVKVKVVVVLWWSSVLLPPSGVSVAFFVSVTFVVSGAKVGTR